MRIFIFFIQILFGKFCDIYILFLNKIFIINFKLNKKLFNYIINKKIKTKIKKLKKIKK